MADRQLDLFGDIKGDVEKPEPRTRVQIGRRIVRINLARKRREALKSLAALLDKLEGKDIWISWCGGARAHFWLDRLKLERMQIERSWSQDIADRIIVLRGERGGCVRIFTEHLIALREQEYKGYTMWLLDFWNGFTEYPIDPYRPPGYESLVIIRLHGKE